MTAHDFRQTRIKLGLTQTELASWLQVGMASISRWEGGTRRIPPYIAKMMDMSVQLKIKRGRLTTT